MANRPRAPIHRCLLLSAVVAALTVPARHASASAISFVFSGGGWGHGVGMSQYGAKGQADVGRSFDQILTHYYQGTSVAPAAMPPEIRVGVLWDVGEVQVTADGVFQFHYQTAGGDVLGQGAAGQVWRVGTDGAGNFVLRRPDGSIVTVPGGPNALFVDYFRQHGSLLRLPQTGFRYKHGWLEINTYTHPATGARLLRAIVVGIDMQRYLYGLGEVPSSWPAEALKAQAVAGRTYAAEKIAREGQTRPTCNCGLYGSTADQAYVGFEKEAGLFGERWIKAVDDTDGRAVLYSGAPEVPPAPIQAFYSSSSGGHTEHSENVFASFRPYLRGVPDPWDAVSPNYVWSVTFDLEDLQNRLNGALGGAVGVLYEVETLPPYGVSGRVLRVVDADEGGVRLAGSGGITRLDGSQVRSILGLRSTLFRVVRTGLHPNGTVIKGSGPAVYRIEDGRLLPFMSPGMLETWIRSPSEVVVVEDASLLQYRGARTGFRDGTLLKLEGSDPTIWIVSGGARRGFTSSEVFGLLGYSVANVLTVTSDELSLHPEGRPVSSPDSHPDGTLLKKSCGSPPCDQTVWWLAGGRKRAVPSAGIFAAWFRDAEIVSYAAARIDAYPDGPLLGYRDGTLMRTGDGTVWIASDGTRRGFTSAGAFEGLGYSWPNVRGVSDGEANVQPVGPPISSAFEPHPSGTLLRASLPYRFAKRGDVRELLLTDRVFASWQYKTAEIVRTSDARLASYETGNPPKGYRDGTLIATPDGTVWIISGGKRRGFATAEAFHGLGYSFANVRGASFGEAGVHPEGSPISSFSAAHPDGTLLRGSSPAVYWMQGGKKRPIPSMAVFDSWFRSSEIVAYFDDRIDSYATGAVLGFRDGALIATPDGTVWAISDGKRRGFASAAAFTGLGYDWADVRSVSPGEAALHPEGDPIR